MSKNIKEGLLQLRQLLTVALVGCFSATAFANDPITSGRQADPVAGEQKAMLCVSCHGQNGISAVPMYPNLAGQKELYLRQQLENFRSGYRPSLVMAPMAKHLTNEDIANLAAYYARLKP